HAVESLCDQCGLPRRRSVRNASRPVTPAMSRTIDQNYPAVHAKPPAEGETKVFEITACAMHEHDRKLLLLRRGTNLHHMHAAALDLDEPPRRRMGSLYAQCCDDRNCGANAENCRNSENEEDHRSHPFAHMADTSPSGTWPGSSGRLEYPWSVRRK